MPAFIQPQLSQHNLKEPAVFIDNDDDSNNERSEFAGSPLSRDDHVVFPSRGFSVESVQLFLAARDSSIECCHDSLLTFETSKDSIECHHDSSIVCRKNARYDLEIEKCCKDLRVVLAKDEVCALRNGSSSCSLNTSVGDDQSQPSDSCEEECDGDEAIDRMYAQADVGRKIGIAREASPKKSRAGVEHLAADEVQAYQDIMREKFDRLGQHSTRPLCHTANPRAAVCDAVSRYYEVSEEIGEYYAMPGDRPSGSGLSDDQQERLSRYARCLADAQVTPTDRPQKPPPAAAPAQEKPKKLMFGLF